MIRIEKKTGITAEISSELLHASKEELLFFDIETTGFSPYRSRLYLIGALCCEGEEWLLIQLFSESLEDESELLREFFRLAEKKRLLISFNGEGFDLPFLKAAAAQYSLTYPLDAVKSLDIFKQLRPARRLLALPNFKLKSCEDFLGLRREDRFSGGELISVYSEYLKSRENELLTLLLLHNAEDLLNLPRILSLLSYALLPSVPAKLESHTLLASSDKESPPLLSLCYRSSLRFPRPLFLERELFCLSLRESRIELRLRLLQGELKYFYADYKNYFYLPKEDTAIHKSVGEFVDPGFREKASVRTAYQKKTGLFLPEPDPVFTPVFFKEYKGKPMYAEYAETLFSDDENAQSLLRAFLRIV